MTPSQLLFGRNPHTSLDMSLPQVDGMEATNGFENFIEERQHNLREVRKALERVYEGREKEQQCRNESIQPPSAGTRVVTGDLVLASASDYSLHRQGMGPNLIHEK